MHEYFGVNRSDGWMSTCNLVEQKGDSADSMSYLDHDYPTYDHEYEQKLSSIDAKYVSTAL